MLASKGPGETPQLRVTPVLHLGGSKDGSGLLCHSPSQEPRNRQRIAGCGVKLAPGPLVSPTPGPEPANGTPFVVKERKLQCQPPGSPIRTDPAPFGCHMSRVAVASST